MHSLLCCSHTSHPTARPQGALSITCRLNAFDLVNNCTKYMSAYNMWDLFRNYGQGSARCGVFRLQNERNFGHLSAISLIFRHIEFYKWELLENLYFALFWLPHQKNRKNIFWIGMALYYIYKAMFLYRQHLNSLYYRCLYDFFLAQFIYYS